MTKQDKIDTALRMHSAGWTLFKIAIMLGVSKDWLREYAGLR